MKKRNYFDLMLGVMFAISVLAVIVGVVASDFKTVRSVGVEIGGQVFILSLIGGFVVGIVVIYDLFINCCSRIRSWFRRRSGGE